jgi:putative ABC transport system substrate-binding protein
MRRRDFVQLLSSAMIMVPWRVAAQTTTKNYHLASLTASSPFLTNSPYIAMLLPALAEHGYKLGQNLEYTPYGADMQLDQLPQIARDITANKIDAVVAFGYPPAAAMKGSSIPTVVAFGAGDPVATGLVDSLARPGGNVTGISDNATTLSTKRLGLLKQAAPNIRTVAMLWNKKDLGMTFRYQASADAAKVLGIAVQPLGVGEPDDFADAFTAMDRNPPDAILMVSDALTVLNRKRVFDYADKHHLPAIPT